MSQGKYSPNLPKGKTYEFNCYGKTPDAWNETVWDVVAYDQKTMFVNYDNEGFDCYGYSAFDADGNYVGPGNGVDRNGYTEYEYLAMDPEDFFDFFR